MKRLVHEDAAGCIYEVTDDDGKVIGRDFESKNPGEDRLSALEAEVRGIKAAAAAQAAKGATVTAQSVADAVAKAAPKGA